MPTPLDPGAIDVHQHLWPDELVDLLRARTRAPYLRGWTLHTDGEPPYDVDPAAHDVEARIAADREAEVGTACLSLSAPLGLERLPSPQARPLVEAWHRGVRELPAHFRAWASVPTQELDADGLRLLLDDDRFVGVQLPATELLTPVAWEWLAPVLVAAESAGKPVFVHPGPQESRPGGGSLPAWWAPVVDYTAQLQAAWWAWHAVGGRSLFPRLRVLFAAGAGLAPLHLERHSMRGGERLAVDPDLYVETSGTGSRSLEALVRVLGIDGLVLGSDRPYAEPLAEFLGAAATHAVRVANPARLLSASTRGGARSWAVAS